MFVKITKDILQKSLNRFGIRNKIDAVSCLKESEKFFKKTFGDDFFMYAKPVFVKNDILAIKIISPIIAEEIQKHEQELMDFVYQKTQVRIKRIRFVN